MPTARCVVLTALALLAAACQPPPRPFASYEANPLLEVPESAGVVVEPITGLPPDAEGALRHAVIASLQNAGILASDGPGNRASFRLNGVGEVAPTRPGAPLRAYVTWELTDAEGRQLTSFTSTPELRPEQGLAQDQRTLANIVRRVSESLEISRTARAPADAPVGRATPPITVLPVEGAPGDGREALARALTVMLRNYGLRVSDTVDADGMLVYGDVAVTPVGPDAERIDMSWALRWPDGREVGRVTQSNTIPAGLVRREWGPIATAAAEGAAAGIAQLVREAAVRSDGAVAAPPNRVYSAGPR